MSREGGLCAAHAATPMTQYVLFKCQYIIQMEIIFKGTIHTSKQQQNLLVG